MPTSADALIAGLVQALRDEERARGGVRAALRRQAELLRALRTAGCPATLVAHRLATAWGAAPTIRDRLRLARRLRKRAQRETCRPPNLAGPRGPEALAASPSDRALMPHHPENDMASKLVKRVITEEFIDTDEERRPCAPTATLDLEFPRLGLSRADTIDQVMADALKGMR